MACILLLPYFSFHFTSQAMVYRGGGFGCSTPPPEILKALQNSAKLNPILKTVKNC